MGMIAGMIAQNLRQGCDFGPLSLLALVVYLLVHHLDWLSFPAVIRIWRQYVEVRLIEKNHNFSLVCSHAVQEFIYFRLDLRFGQHFWYENVVETLAKVLHLHFYFVSKVVEYDVAQVFGHKKSELGEVSFIFKALALL